MYAATQDRRRQRPASLNTIKPDPDAPSLVSQARIPARNVEVEHSDSEDDSISTQELMQPSSTRFGRSDAPPPSEPVTETEPVFREVRKVAGAARPGASLAMNAEESFFHDSFQAIGKKLKQCNDTLGELQQLGVSHDVQLPELVLVGDQSAGKSSLMSGLANLDLPRSEGTCTRCPLHIRVSRNSDWSCRVSLRKEYTYLPPRNGIIDKKDVTRQNPFFPWQKKTLPSILDFKTVNDKNDIEDVLRWAQIAILNDEQQFSLFVPGSGSIAVNTRLAQAAETTTAKFSPNVVALEIKGPDLPDLSFYDMPGIFQNPADARDSYLVTVVRNLSSAYMCHPSAIILCSMPMNTDAENSSTLGLTRELQAESRTIGVLTKADLLPESDKYDAWLAILRGQSHATGHGYFITSRPQGKDLEELKKWEERVFQDHSFEKWPGVFKDFSDRCGVEKLKAYLSERLGAEFAKSLPTIKSKVKDHLDKVETKLSKLPELPRNVELEIQTGLLNFGDGARARMDDFVRHFGPLPLKFCKCLLEIKPKFILKDRSDIPVLEISDDESDTSTARPTPSKRQAPHHLTTPSKRRGDTVAVNGSFCNARVKPEEATGSPVSATPPPRRPAMEEPFTAFSHLGSGFRTIRRVREEIQEKTKAGMPGLISDDVYDDLVKEAIAPWEGPTRVFIKQTMKDLQSDLDRALNQSLVGLKKRTIFTEAKKHVHQCLDEQRGVTEQALLELYHDERERLMTFNEAAFKKYQADELIALTRFRHQMRMQAAGLPTRQLVPWDEMREEQRAQDSKRREAEMVKLGPDQFAREIEVVAYVRGYYRLAALRFADAVSQRILCRMIPAIRRKLPSYLEDRLGLRGPDSQRVYERLMEEDEKTAQLRETLKGEREKFSKALSSIELLESGGGGGEGGEDEDEDEDEDDGDDVTAAAAADIEESTQPWSLHAEAETDKCGG